MAEPEQEPAVHAAAAIAAALTGDAAASGRYLAALRSLEGQTAVATACTWRNRLAGMPGPQLTDLLPFRAAGLPAELADSLTDAARFRAAGDDAAPAFAAEYLSGCPTRAHLFLLVLCLAVAAVVAQDIRECRARTADALAPAG